MAGFWVCGVLCTVAMVLALYPGPVRASNAAANLPVYTVSVVPQFPAADLARTWSPILSRLGQLLGVRLELSLARDIPSFEAEVAAGVPDLAYLNPYHQLVAAKGQGYIPLVRDTQLLTGILVVRRDDPIRHPRELDGQSVAFPAPNAFGASLLIRAHLQEIERVTIQPVYARTHTNAYRHTLVGKTVATGGLRATLEREPDDAQAGLRILLETPGAAPHPLSAHPRVPATLRQALQRAWMQLAQEPAMLPHLQAIPMVQPMLADQARDYQPLERLRLDRYSQ
jgi:phosphonate transport system substrate-binding protein